MRHILYLLSVTTLLTACTQDELTDNGQGTPLPEPVPLELTTGNLYGAVVMPSTRGTVDGNWWDAHNVAVQVYGKVKKYHVVPDGNNASLYCPDIAIEDTDFWWTRNNERKAVTAWYPYREACPETWQVSTVQTAATIANEDLMYGYVNAMTRDNPSITFQHLLAKVNINLVRSEYLDDAQRVNVSLTNQYQTAVFTVGPYNIPLINGTGSSNVNITPYRLPTPRVNYYASYLALVIPLEQVASTKSHISINVDGTNYQCKISDILQTSIPFTSGYEYTLDITVDAKGLQVSVKESIGWSETDSSGSGSVTLP